MNNLQKIALSLTAIFSFGFYALAARSQDDQLTAVASSRTVNANQVAAVNPETLSPAQYKAYIDQINAQAAKVAAAQKKNPPPIPASTQPTKTPTQSASAQSIATARAKAAQSAIDRQKAAAQTVVEQQAAERAAQQLAAQQAAELAAQQQAAQQAAQLAQQQAAQQEAANLAAQQAAQQAAAQAQATQNSGQYKNGTYTGSSVDVFYGMVQVQVSIQGGQIADVTFLQYPSDRSTSRRINSQAMPMLKQEAIQAQSASVDGVSGATATSQGFIQSLGNALTQAQA